MPDDSERNLKELLGEEVEELALQQVEEIPETLPVLPVRGAVLFPGAIMPILVATDSSLRLVRAVLEGDGLLVVTAVKDVTG